MRDRLAFLRRLHHYGDLVRVHIGPWRALVVTSAELTGEMLVADRVFDKGGYLFDRIRETGGNGLVSCPHRDHRRQRRLVQPAFHRDRLPGYLRMMSRQIDVVLAGWRDGETVDVRTDMQAITARTLLPRGLPPAVMEQMFTDMHVILAGVTWRAIVPKRLDRVPTPANRRYRRAQERLRAIVAGLVAEHRSRETDHDDLLSGLLSSYDPDGLTEDEIHDQVLTFLLAGTETTANVVSWALHLLAGHPDIERRLRAEAVEVVGDGEVTVADLSRLAVCRQVVLETMRLYPPVPFLTRLTTEDTELGGHPVPAGTTIAYSPYAVQRQAAHFPDPDDFRPGRWAEHADPLRPPRGPFLAFGGGARRCVGDVLGLAEATLMVSAIVRRWSLRPVPGPPVRPAVSLVLTPRALRMRLHAADPEGAAA
ncbi:cytochrome P450 [Amorphoplanes auranticolor]|uniref:Cytochrome P450 n=2 Tax=Actinoplanes auranticolor TaxID=47988 RepID=A0A919VSB2_9ACTN|nr:cytochrome P450 [Actinoplanes auranticolor]